MVSRGDLNLGGGGGLWTPVMPWHEFSCTRNTVCVYVMGTIVTVHAFMKPWTIPPPSYVFFSECFLKILSQTQQNKLSSKNTALVLAFIFHVVYMYWMNFHAITSRNSLFKTSMISENFQSCCNAPVYFTFWYIFFLQLLLVCIILSFVLLGNLTNLLHFFRMLCFI